MAQPSMFIGVQSVGRASALVGALMALMAYWDRWDPAPSFEAARTGSPPFAMLPRVGEGERIGLRVK